MSAVKVLVPRTWLVRTRVQTSGATVVNRSARASEAGEGRPDLLVTGTALASAVVVTDGSEVRQGAGAGTTDLDAAPA